MPGKPDDRKARSIIYGALITLLVIWILKFSLPHSSVTSTSPSPDRSDSSSISTGPAPVSALKPSPSSTTTAAILKPSSGVIASPEPTIYNGTIYDKVAVIIEDRPRINLIPLILHFSAVLGPSWPVIIYTSSENVGIFASSAALGRSLRMGIISIRILPSTILFTNSDSVSSFLTKPWLWENLAPAKHILMFQSDSMLCSNAARSVEDFFEYDFVGAPIVEHLGPGMNGGFSLRKRETFLAITEEWDWEVDRGRRFEDLWFFDRIVELMARQEEAGIENGITLPSMEVARTFSVETIDYPHPLGVHQVHRWLGQQMVSLDDWCPEWKICSQEYIKDG